MARILKKILSWILRGIKCQKFGVLDISQTGHLRFSIFCKLLEDNKIHHVSLVTYLGSNLIQELTRGLDRD